MPSFLRSASTNFQRAVDSLSEAQAASNPARVLAICALGDEPPLRVFHDTDGWSSTSPDDHSLVLSNSDGDNTLVLVAGRQVVTQEKLEVLSLFSSHPIECGLSLSETVEQVQSAEGVPVLPWGFGKWTFKRRSRLDDFLSSFDRAENTLFLGDNGCRWHSWRSSVLSKAETVGIPTLAGSDPLPLDSHTHRAGTFGSILKNRLDLENPTKWLRNEVRQTKQSPPTFGQCRRLAPMFSDQVRLRLKKL